MVGNARDIRSWEASAMFINLSVDRKCTRRWGEMQQICCTSQLRNNGFSDGNKRIAAAIFLCFLDKNGALFDDGMKLIDAHALVAMMIMIAEFKPEEKEMMISVIINCLSSR